MSHPLANVDRGADRWFGAAFLVAVALAAALRLVLLDRPSTLSPDESYSAYAASLPLGEIVPFVRETDPHPPLFYLLLAPVARLSSDEAALRVPSALCSLSAVVVMAWWQRRRGLEGLAATALLAVLPVALSYGSQARMYGLLQLAGVTAATASTRWLETERRRWMVVAVGAGLVAGLAHATGFLLLTGLLVLPGRRLRGEALVWRLGVVAALGVYVLVWGATAFAQREASLYGPVTINSAVITLNETVAPVPANRWIGVTVLSAGVVAVLVRRDTLSRVLVAAYLLPLIGAAAVGTRVGVFIPKTLVVLEWGVAVALAGLMATAWRWRSVAGVVAGVIVVALVVPAVPATLNPSGAEDIIERLRSVVREGDVIANHPPDNVLRWYVFRDSQGRLRQAPDLGWPDTVAAKLGDAPWSGRVWLVDSTFLGPPLELDAPSCGPVEVLPERRRLRCVSLEPGHGRW